ncbi:MAG: tautomerase family protein [Sulfuricurvum sp.]
MPVTKIEACTPRSQERIQSIIQAVYIAQREALQLPENDRNIRYIEHKAEHFCVPPDKSKEFILIEITLFAGRSMETKRTLYKMLVDNLTKLGIASNDISIILYEVPLENWGIRGGVPASEVDIGFNITI